MWRFALGVVLAVCLAGQSVFGGWVIESEPEAPKPGEEAKVKVTVRIEGKMSRVDVGDTASFLLEGEGGGMVMLMHKEKTFMNVPAERLAKLKQGKGGAPKELKKATATGKKDKISGYNVEEYVAVTPEETKTFWVCKEGKDVEKLRDAMTGVSERMSVNSPQVVDYASLPGYPIRTITFTPAKSRNTTFGVVKTPEDTSTFTATSIKEETLEESVFKTPAGYTDVEAKGK